jgi:hypothetical protein
MRTMAIVILVASTWVGCAHKKPEVADGEHLTEFQKTRLLGHYSTIDGKSGFVLDRTVDPPKARLDGDGTVHELAKEGSVHGAIELVSSDRKIWLRIDDESGEVLLFDGPQQMNGVDVVRDADADRL